MQKKNNNKFMNKNKKVDYFIEIVVYVRTLYLKKTAFVKKSPFRTVIFEDLKKEIRLKVHIDLRNICQFIVEVRFFFFFAFG